MLVRGIVLGGLSASGLSLLFLGAVALVAPPPDLGSPTRTEVPLAPRAAAPGAAPQTRPGAPPPADAQVATGAAQAPTTGIALPAGSQFGRAPQDAQAARVQPDAGPARSIAATAPAAPQAAPEGFAPETDAAAQPDITVALAPVRGPGTLANGPDAPAPVIEGAPTTFRSTGLDDGAEGREARGPGPVIVVEATGGTIAPTAIADDQAPPPRRPSLEPVTAPDAAAIAGTATAPNAAQAAPPVAGQPADGQQTPTIVAIAPEAAPSGPNAVTLTPGADFGAAAPVGEAETAQSASARPADASPVQAAPLAQAAPSGLGRPGPEPSGALPSVTSEGAPRILAPGEAVGAVSPDQAPDLETAAADPVDRSPSLEPVAEVAASEPPILDPTVPAAPMPGGAAQSDVPQRAEGAEGDAVIALRPVDALDRPIPDPGAVADAALAGNVAGETEAPQAPTPPVIALAQLNLGGAPGTTPEAGPDSGAPNAPSVTGTPDGPGLAAASRVTAVPDEAVVEAPRREVEGPAPAPIVPRVITPGQPRRITLDSETGAPAQTADAQGEEVDATVDPATDPDAPAIRRNAAAFQAQGDRPLFGIVLIDDGAGVSAANLAAIDFPVTFALDATQEGAGERAQAYRDAGHEVVLLAEALPASGPPQDLEIALAGALRALPQATAVLDTPDRRLARNRESLPALADSGHGLVTHPVGLGTAVAEARRAGVPAAQLYRLLDEDGERATVIARYLDRATFEAVQDGTAIVVGRARPETVTAIYSWRLGQRADQVQVAPLSAVLLAAQDQ